MMEVPKNDGQCSDGLKSLNADEAHKAFIFRPIECVTRHPGISMIAGVSLWFGGG